MEFWKKFVELPGGQNKNFRFFDPSHLSYKRRDVKVNVRLSYPQVIHMSRYKMLWLGVVKPQDVGLWIKL
jgi:hypothetical protein